MSVMHDSMPISVDANGVRSALFVHPDDVALNTVKYRSHLEKAGLLRRLKAATVPESCGEQVHYAPARGRLMQRPLRKVEMTQQGRPVLRPDSEVGRDGKRIMGARISDVWDTIEHQARAAYRKNALRAEAAGLEPAPYCSPYSVGQVNAARDYAALVERLHGSGMKCSSLEAHSGGAGGNGAREEAIMRDIDRLRFIRGRIGDDIAKEVQRPSRKTATDDPRQSISVRRVVDRIALDGWALGRILKASGWADTGSNRKDLSDALRSALDRMQGYDAPATQ